MAQDKTNGGPKGPRKPGVHREDSGGLSGVAIRRPVFTAMIMLGLVTMGIFSFRTRGTTSVATEEGRP